MPPRDRLSGVVVNAIRDVGESLLGGPEAWPRLRPVRNAATKAFASEGDLKSRRRALLEMVQALADVAVYAVGLRLDPLLSRRERPQGEKDGHPVVFEPPLGD